VATFAAAVVGYFPAHRCTMITKVHNDSLSEDTFAASLPQRVACPRESVRLCRKDANLGLDCDLPLNTVGLAGRLQVRENSQRLVNDSEHIDTMQQSLDWANLLLPRGVARSRRILGDDHLQTLASASNLANDLQGLGDYRAARELDEDTLARRRRILGDDHPETLNSANSLAVDLQGLGDYEAALQLCQETVTRYSRVLRDDHPDTIRSADNLTAIRHALSEEAT
jgi:hypothetical protein